MKKLIPFLLSATMIGSLLPSAQGAIPNYKWTFEDFEKSDVSITTSNASGTWSAGGAGDSAGCLHIKASKDYGTVKFNSYLEKGVTYKASAWVKVAGTIPTNQNFQFLFYMHSIDSAGMVSEGMSAYKTVTASGVPYSADWEYVETTFTHDGKGRIAGQGDVNVADGEGTVEIRIGDGKMSSSTNGDPFDYYIDDFTVEPIFEQEAEAPVEPDTPAPPDFDNGDFSNPIGSEWTLNGTTAVLTNSDLAPEGYTSSANFTGKGYGTYFSQGIQISRGEHCKISFWAKSNAGDLEFTPVLSRDTYSTEYLYEDGKSSSNNDTSLTKSVMSYEWKLFEYDYTEQTGANPYLTPTFYLRCGARTTIFNYNVTGFTITRDNPSADDTPVTVTDPRVASIDVEGRCVEGDTLTFSAVTENADASFYRILKEYKSGYVCLGSDAFTGNDVTYTIKTADVGSKLRFMVMPITQMDSLGKYRYVETSPIMALLNLEPTLTANLNATSNASVKVINNNSTPAELFIVLALFDDNNAMCGYASKGATISAGDSDTLAVELDAVEGASRARLFIWQGNNEFTTKGKALLASLNNE